MPKRKSPGPGDVLAPGLLAWERLGAGELSAVWLAWSLEWWAPVTVKMAHGSPAQVNRAREYLAHEGQLLMQLSHPCLQRLLAARLDGPRPHLVFDYVEGPSLGALLEDGPMSHRDVRLAGLQLLSVLHYLHGTGLAHLDVTPANVLLRDGRIVLLDIELARPLGYVRGRGLPNGTEGYQAPEYLARAPVTPGMDVYAVGVLLAELLVGDDIESPVEASGQLEDVGASPAMIAALSRMLDPDPATRCTTASQALALLAKVDSSEPLWPAWADAHLADAPARGLVTDP